MAQKVTVLLVDDHALVRRGFRRILEDEEGIKVVGEASDGMEAVEMAFTLKPAVILMDCAMPRMDGFAATKQILEARPSTTVLMLSMHSEDTWVREAVKAGARGYILKNAGDMDLGSAIQRAVSGELVLDPQIESLATTKSGREAQLSPRELEVLQLIVNGKSNFEIAIELGLSENTIGVHRSRIMATLGIHKTAELVMYAVRKRLVKIP